MMMSSIPTFGRTPSKPATLLMSDVDESFIYGKDGNYHTDELTRTVDTIHQLQQNKQQPFYVWWSTVRVLDTIKKIVQNPALKTILNGFYLDGLVVNNGKQMFVNSKHLPTADWISSLQEAHQEVQWQNHIENVLGWKSSTLDASIRSVLKTAGFKKKSVAKPINASNKLLQFIQKFWYGLGYQLNGVKHFILPIDDLRPPYEIWQNKKQKTKIVYYSPLHNALRLARWQDKTHWQAANDELTELANRLYQKLIEAKAKAEPIHVQEKLAHDSRTGNTLSLLRLSPVSVNKATTTQFVVNKLVPPIENIIVVGDDKPDELLLKTDYTQTIDKQTTPLQKKTIICNQPGREDEQSPLAHLLSDPSFPKIKAPSGDIGNAITQAHQELTDN